MAVKVTSSTSLMLYAGWFFRTGLDKARKNQFHQREMERLEPFLELLIQRTFRGPFLQSFRTLSWSRRPIPFQVPENSIKKFPKNSPLTAENSFLVPETSSYMSHNFLRPQEKKIKSKICGSLNGQNLKGTEKDTCANLNSAFFLIKTKVNRIRLATPEK